MVRRPFFYFGKPKLCMTAVEDMQLDLEREVPLSNQFTLLIKDSKTDGNDLKISVGDAVTTGQKLHVFEGTDDYLVSPATGVISSIQAYTGYLGQAYRSIVLETKGEEQWDDALEKQNREDLVETAIHYLKSLPGAPDFAGFLNLESPLDTLVVCGLDVEPMVRTQQSILKTDQAAVKRGGEILGQLLKPNQMLFLVAPGDASLLQGMEVDIREVESEYPNTLPQMVMKHELGKTVPAGGRCEDQNVGFINVEALKSLAEAIDTGKAPVNKRITVLGKGRQPLVINARIGTPVREIFASLNMETESGDRIIFGGPMRGLSVYSEEMPVSEDTDAIILQSQSDITPSSDTPCVNCGECVRTCPADIPVNMLVRLLENGLYEEAVTEYDLQSCIECGMCSYVCIAQIPVFHFIMLGKHEYTKIQAGEELHG